MKILPTLIIPFLILAVIGCSGSECPKKFDANGVYIYRPDCFVDGTQLLVRFLGEKAMFTVKPFWDLDEVTAIRKCNTIESKSTYGTRKLLLMDDSTLYENFLGIKEVYYKKLPVDRTLELKSIHLNMNWGDQGSCDGSIYTLTGNSLLHTPCYEDIEGEENLTRLYDGSKIRKWIEGMTRSIDWDCLKYSQNKQTRMHDYPIDLKVEFKNRPSVQKCGPSTTFPIEVLEVISIIWKDKYSLTGPWKPVRVSTEGYYKIPEFEWN